MEGGNLRCGRDKLKFGVGQTFASFVIAYCCDVRIAGCPRHLRSQIASRIVGVHSGRCILHRGITADTTVLGA